MQTHPEPQVDPGWGLSRVWDQEAGRGVPALSANTPGGQQRPQNSLSVWSRDQPTPVWAEERPCPPPPLRPFHLISHPASSQRPEADSAPCLPPPAAHPPVLPPQPTHAPALSLPPLPTPPSLSLSPSKEPPDDKALCPSEESASVMYATVTCRACPGAWTLSHGLQG